MIIIKIDHFDEWEAEIRDFCSINCLDFEAIKKLSRGNGADFLILYYYDQNVKKFGLLQEECLPVVMLVKKTVEGLVIEKTPFAENYLK